MRAAKGWIVVAAVGLTIGSGACSGGKSAINSNAPATTTRQVAGQQSSTPSPASTRTSTTKYDSTGIPAIPGQVATPETTTTRLTPQGAADLILGITDQIQQAESTPNGPKALTRAQAQAIVDAQKKALGITP